MALPIACVAPVTMHTKPYYRQLAYQYLVANQIKSYQLAISSIRRKMLTLISLEDSVGAHLVSMNSCLDAKLMSIEERANNDILSRTLSISLAWLSPIYGFTCRLVVYSSFNVMAIAVPWR